MSPADPEAPSEPHAAARRTRVYIALVHYPILNRKGETVTTAVTNLDIHDLARSARTYGVDGYYIITPVEQQRGLVQRITGHWAEGKGKTYHPIRAEAIARVHVASSIAEAIAAIGAQNDGPPIVIGTSARREQASISYSQLAQRFDEEDGTALLLFGTGWGLTPEAMAAVDEILPPITAIPCRAGYNHLSVRSAVAIILDRVLGQH